VPCFSPVTGYRNRYGQLTQNITKTTDPSKTFTIPCGGCIGCRVTKTSEWASRAILELRGSIDSCFITLTYKNTPPGGSLHPPHLRDFWKRLRIFTSRRSHNEPALFPLSKIRYFACGEYGEKKSRPHYHAVVFGYRPSDGVLFKQTDFGPLFSSVELQKVWTHGFVTFGAVAFESCAYVASYVQKKLTGRQGALHYGNLWSPFARMSRRPGLGRAGAIELQNEVSDDKLWLGGDRFSPVPKYFMNLYKELNPELFETLSLKRESLSASQQYRLDQSHHRLKVREQVFAALLSQSHKENHHADF